MVKIRLKRLGRKRHPFYRIVVADESVKRDGKVIEEIGYYYPEKSVKNTLLKEYDIDVVKYEAWLKKGAKPTDPVKKIMNKLQQN